MLEDDSELEAAIHDHQVFRFTDTDVRRFVDQKWQAGLAANEYYSIPAKVGVSTEGEDELRPLADSIQAIATSQQIPFDLALVKSDHPWEMKAKIRRYRSLPENPKRAIWRQQNRDKYELYRTFYSDVPLGIEQPEMAGVGG